MCGPVETLLRTRSTQRDWMRVSCTKSTTNLDTVFPGPATCGTSTSLTWSTIKSNSATSHREFPSSTLTAAKKSWVCTLWTLRTPHASLKECPERRVLTRLALIGMQIRRRSTLTVTILATFCLFTTRCKNSWIWPICMRWRETSDKKLTVKPWIRDCSVPQKTLNLLDGLVLVPTPTTTSMADIITWCYRMGEKLVHTGLALCKGEPVSLNSSTTTMTRSKAFRLCLTGRLSSAKLN